MNVHGKRFPRIFSISTVGIRKHNNCDFLIHPIRTDFTGQSATGKSLIGADLPQLILTAGKFYKSATASNEPREYNQLPINNFGYSFINIEKEKGKFLAIGVFIQKAPKSITPFIISAEIGLRVNDEKTKISKIKLFEKIVRFEDFITNDEIPTLQNLRENLERKGLYLTSFFHKIPDYHKILFDNKILHINISNDENLQKQYAHTLQALSRGSGIETKGIKFKRFLFQYDDDIANKFHSQSEEIENNQRKYHNDWKTQHSLLVKKEILVKLLKLKRKKVESKESRLNFESVYNFNLQKQKKDELQLYSEEQFEIELEILTIKQKKLTILKEEKEAEIKSIELDLESNSAKLNEVLSEYEKLSSEIENIQEILALADSERESIKLKNDRIIRVDNWLKLYEDLNTIVGKFNSQIRNKLRKRKLEDLNIILATKGLKVDFQNSKYSSSVNEAYLFYSQEREKLETEISNTEKLKKIFEAKSPNSFAGYVLKNNISLTKLQESVLFAFASTPIKYDKEVNYILDPHNFILNLISASEDENEFVLNLSGLHYHIKKRSEYVLSDLTTLKIQLEKIGSDFDAKIESLKIQLNEITKWDCLLNELNYSEEHLEAYLSKEEITSYKYDDSLNLTEEEFRNSINEFNVDATLDASSKSKYLYNQKLKEYESKLVLKNQGEEKLIKLYVDKNRYQEFNQTSTEKLDSLKNEMNTNINFELGNISNKINSWKDKIENPLRLNYETVISKIQSRIKSLSTSQKLEEKNEELIRRSGTLEAEIRGLNNMIPQLEMQYDNSHSEYIMYYKKEFNPDIILQSISAEKVALLKSEESVHNNAYLTAYAETLDIDEIRDYIKDSVELRNHNHDLKTLINAVIPKEIITDIENPENSLENDIEKQLAELNRKLKELNMEEARKLFNTVRELKNIVYKQTEFIEKSQSVLKDFKLATHHSVKIEYKNAEDYNINWIRAFSEDIENANFTDSLFGEADKITAQELLENTFKKYCPSRINAKASEILNPFNYYEASAKIVDPNGNPSPGSTGQNYGMLALLCILKLSINEGKLKDTFDKIEEGIRILPIDEVAGLGENFDMLYDIAQKLDYQIFTMTIKSQDLEFQDGKQICYEFIPSSDPQNFLVNEGVQATFSKMGLIDDINTHFENNDFIIYKA